MPSIHYASPLDMHQYEVQQLRLHQLATAPSSPVTGEIWYDTANNLVKWWNGSAHINPLSRANHSGTQAASTISDLAAVVQAYSLDLFAPPAANLDMDGFRIVGMSDPSDDQDAATKLYVDTAVQSAQAGIASKPACRAVATSNVTLSGLQTVDGISLGDGDACLVQNNTTETQNGPYIVHSGAWTRRLTEDQDGEINPGSMWFISEGTTYGGTQWICGNTGDVDIGVDDITINQWNAGTAYTASLGVQLVGNDIRANYGTGLTLSGNQLIVDYAAVPKKPYSTTFGNGSLQSFTITHNLGTQTPKVSFRLTASPYTAYEFAWEATSTNAITVYSAGVPSSGEFTVSVSE